MLLPVSEVAGAGPPLASVSPRICDVALGPQGRLAGTVSDQNGNPWVGTVTVTGHGSGHSRQVRSSAAGQFAVEGISAGVYRVATDEVAVVCRCWDAGTAPPAATQEVFLVSGETVHRGQRPLAEMLFCPPVLIGAIIVAAVAIPIIVHNSNDDAS